MTIREHKNEEVAPNPERIKRELLLNYQIVHVQPFQGFATSD